MTESQAITAAAAAFNDAIESGDNERLAAQYSMLANGYEPTPSRMAEIGIKAMARPQSESVQ